MLSRRRFAPLLALVVLAGAAVCAARAARPNIVLVLTDDHGFGDLGLHGNPHIRTPNIDRFGREGVQLTRFYVSPVCSPTRASLMTGRWHYRTGILHTSRGGAKMHGDEVTVAEVLRAAGYRTGIFGKWHLGDTYPMRPTDQGFEEALIHKSGGINQGPDEPSSYFDPRLWHNNEPLPTTGYCTDVFFAAALKFIEQNRDRPFFVYIPTNAPHTPLQVSESYRARYQAMGLDDTTARVYGMVENIDENFARLIATLERLHLRENTLVIFMTDNGPQQNRFNAGLRGRKGMTYEGGIRVPSFWQWPAEFAGGRSIDRIAAHIDVLPTLLDVAGARRPAEAPPIDGVSLRPLLAGKASVESWPERTLFLQVHRGLEPRLYQNCAAITQRFKLVGYPGTFNREDLDPSKTAPVLELYDLSSDRAEETNLARQQPEVLAKLRREYEAWFASVQSSRGFRPGVIHLGAEAEPATHLSRYQDGGYPGGVKSGWQVKVLRAGRYAVTYVRGENKNAGQLALQWAGRITRQPLPADADAATFELGAGEGILDVWLETADGKRLAPAGEGERNGDAIVRRL